MKIIELQMQNFQGLIIKNCNEIFIVINTNLTDVEKQKIINCLHTRIELQQFDFLLIDNTIVPNNEEKKE